MTISLPRDRRGRARTRLRAAQVSVGLTAVMAVSTVATTNAHAVDPQTVITAAKTAYSVYQAMQANQLTLQQATDRIVGAIDAAKNEIIGHIDAIATADARACAKAAVIDLEDLPDFTPDTVQAFARDTTNCLTLIDSLLVTVVDKGALDQLGFALNSVGPVALLARRHAGFSATATRTMLVSANQTVVSRLYPVCQASPLWGDAPPGGLVEVRLRCRAYNGDLGHDTAFSRTPRTTTYTFTRAANQATRHTSRAVAQAVLPML